MERKQIIPRIIEPRLLPLRLDPLSLAERIPPTLQEALLYGSLPGVALAADGAARARQV